ncbi:MAG: cysteine--tRNA ligase [Nitrospinota bacterium]|nr:cysteine--tRNA ligase [Nitrospinota bacterium]
MSLRIYNSLTGQKEEFVPLDPPKVRMYVCGVTVYDLCHIGHARSAIVFDVIYRYLKFSGYDVTYARNFTDVDDKIINRANETGMAWDQVAGKYIAEFYNDMGPLGLMAPDVEPKATDHIPEMLDMISDLVEKGIAYESEGSVYYSVKKFPEYGRLSGKNIDDLLSGARVDVDERKKNPLDFALWKASKPGEPWWDSPWGKGRPGWHIECSAMGRKYLGEVFDIHGGGKDLAFPHHENEIAQSQGCSGKAPVKLWVHNGFVNVNQEKMSKSLGNFFTIKDILAKAHPETVRLFLMSSQYRSPIDFSPEGLTASGKNLARFYDLLAVKDSIAPEVAKAATLVEESVTAFREAMDDDFNTAVALAHMNTELKRLNQLRAGMEKMKKKSPQYAEALTSLASGIVTLEKLGAELGMFISRPAVFIQMFRQTRLAETGMTNEEVEAMINKRTIARKEKNFAEADHIRGELTARGILLHDKPDGTTWSASLD